LVEWLGRSGGHGRAMEAFWKPFLRFFASFQGQKESKGALKKQDGGWMGARDPTPAHERQPSTPGGKTWEELSGRAAWRRSVVRGDNMKHVLKRGVVVIIPPRAPGTETGTGFGKLSFFSFLLWFFGTAILPPFVGSASSDPVVG